MLAGELEVIQKVILTAKSDKKREKAKARKAKLEAKKAKLELWVNEKASAQEVNSVVGAFVMFETQDAADDCVRHYSSKGSKAVLPCLKPRPEFLLDSMHQISVSKAVEPSDLLFENLEVGSWNRSLRKVASSFASFIVIIVSFAVIVYGKSYNEALKVTDTQCINTTTISHCNDAVNWAAITSIGCPSGLSSCTLAQVRINHHNHRYKYPGSDWIDRTSGMECFRRGRARGDPVTGGCDREPEEDFDHGREQLPAVPTGFAFPLFPCRSCFATPSSRLNLAFLLAISHL